MKSYSSLINTFPKKKAIVRYFLVLLGITLIFPNLKTFSHAKDQSHISSKDWLASPDPLAMPVFPKHDVTIKQNPPIFRWAYSQDQDTYVVRLKTLDGYEKEFQTTNNWLFLSSLLPPGNYQWQVRKSTSSTWSHWRTFYVSKSTYPFLMPNPQILFEKASKTSRPRALPKGEEKKRLFSELLTGSRKQGFSQLQKSVERSFQLTMSSDELKIFNTGSKFAIRKPARKAMHQGLKPAYAWWITGNPKQLDQAKSRALTLARLDPSKGTGRKNEDLISQEISLTLARLYDLLYLTLSDKEKKEVTDAIVIRIQDLHQYYIADERHGLANHPFSSHGVRHAGAISAIATLLAGDIEIAESWFMNTFPVYAAIIPPWGGEDGGYANGTNYAIWDALTFIEHWDILKQTIGVDFTKASWAQEFGRFLTYFLPQGTPRGVFGDGAELSRPKAWATLAAIYAQRIRSRISQHYAQQWNHTPWNRLSFLFGPLEPLAELSHNTKSSEKLSPSTLVSSIGWAAFHSNLSDPNRTSIYFKSSPYGSFNHSHANQNSFIIFSGSRPLAIESGYYDLYWSPHHKNWTIQTRAHNAITVDGGIGQKSRSMAAKGKILDFQEKGEYGYVIGDATPSYDGLLTKAIRTLLYIRPNYLLIYDLLESREPHYWEWNIHTEKPFKKKNREISTSNPPTSSLCIENLYPSDVNFQQTDKFSDNPSGRHVQSPKQWHGTFTSTQEKNKYEFLFLLKVNCAKINISHVNKLPQGGFSFHIENRSGEISISQASLKDKQSPNPPANIRIY